MNGLCAMFGSGMPEMYELIRLLQFCSKVCEQFPGRDVTLPAEINTLLIRSELLVDAYYDGTPTNDFEFWDELAQYRDDYRNQTSVTFSGDTVSWSAASMAGKIDKLLRKCVDGVVKAVELNGGITPTYFTYDPIAYEKLDTVDANGLTNVKISAFEVGSVPLFLEGPVRQMKTVTSPEERKAIYDKVKASDMYDEKLKMYKISGSLASMPIEIGRMVAFSPGWLENESIWLHMSYKFYLELLRGEMYQEYFDEIKTGLVAFMDPEIYGRSPLECSSFIASSAHPDKSIHGQGYLARLSGSTAEYLSMYNIMMMGVKGPFVDKGNGLELKLAPVLASWLYDDANALTFTMLGSIQVTYHFPDAETNSWDCFATNTEVTFLDGSVAYFGLGTIPSPVAKQVRNLEVASIEMYFEKS